MKVKNEECRALIRADFFWRLYILPSFILLHSPGNFLARAPG